MEVFYIFFFLLTLTVKSSISQANEGEAEVELSNIKYDLTITTTKKHFEDDGQNTKLEGNVEISFDFKGNPKEFSLDASSKMEIKNFKINDKVVSPERKGNKIIFKNDKFKNPVLLAIKYSVPFGEDMTGIYRSSYKTSEGKNRWIITSHFEPIFARNAFPCFDNPKLKAEFDLKVIIPKTLNGYYVLSNNPCEIAKEFSEEGATEDTVTYNCANTKKIKMSTYLLALTISDLECSKAVTIGKTKTQLRTCGQSDMIKYGAKLAQDIGAEAVKKLEEYLDFPYALEKIDQVGIPDFSAGAMENWGLILFRETKLFFNEKRDSILTKQSIISTIIHELVHQWFGNLVTLESWNYIWLNEAFATYLQYLIASKFAIENPKLQDWGLLNQQVVNEIHLRAFETDGLISSKSMTHDIKDESLIFSFFNDINYSKGSAVLRMWDLTLGGDKFQKSLQTYLKERQFASANPNQLLNFLKPNGMEERFFKSWTENPGYPVVTVTKSDKKYTLSQNRFLFEKSKDENTCNRYYIPITYFTNKKEPGNIVWLKEDPSSTIEITSDKETWIVVNVDQQGYYRVNYDENNWNALAAALSKDPSKIRELNRAQIVNDIFSLARSNQQKYVNYKTAMNLALFLEKEESFVVWKTALHSFDFLRSRFFGDKKLNSYFENYLLKIISPHFKGLSIEDSDHLSKLKNIEISKWACSLDHKPCIDDALKLYEENKNSLHTEDIILCTAVRLKKDAFKAVLEKYDKETDNIKKTLYLNALGCSGDKKQIEELLKDTINENSKFRKQDRIYVISSVINGNMNNVQTAFSFIKENYEKIATMYGGIDPLGRAIVSIAKKLNVEDDLKKFTELVENIKKNQKTAGSKENAENALQIVQSNVNWLTEKKMDIFSYFDNSSSVFSISIGLLAACLFFTFNF